MILFLTPKNEYPMTLYELFHSVPPEVLLRKIRQINSKNDILFSLESKCMHLVLNTQPEKSDKTPIYVIRNRQLKPLVAFDTSLGAEITLGKLLARRVMISDQLKNLHKGIIAAYCYCALPVGIVLKPGGKCKVSQVFDPKNKSIVTRIYDNILFY